MKVSNISRMGGTRDYRASSRDINSYHNRHKSMQENSSNSENSGNYKKSEDSFESIYKRLLEDNKEE